MRPTDVCTPGAPKGAGAARAPDCGSGRGCGSATTPRLAARPAVRRARSQEAARGHQGGGGGRRGARPAAAARLPAGGARLGQAGKGRGRCGLLPAGRKRAVQLGGGGQPGAWGREECGGNHVRAWERRAGRGGWGWGCSVLAVDMWVCGQAQRQPGPAASPPPLSAGAAHATGRLGAAPTRQRRRTGAGERARQGRRVLRGRDAGGRRELHLAPGCAGLGGLPLAAAAQRPRQRPVRVSRGLGCRNARAGAKGQEGGGAARRPQRARRLAGSGLRCTRAAEARAASWGSAARQLRGRALRSTTTHPLLVGGRPQHSGGGGTLQGPAAAPRGLSTGSGGNTLNFAAGALLAPSSFGPCRVLWPWAAAAALLSRWWTSRSGWRAPPRLATSAPLAGCLLGCAPTSARALGSKLLAGAACWPRHGAPQRARPMASGGGATAGRRLRYNCRAG